MDLKYIYCGYGMLTARLKCYGLNLEQSVNKVDICLGTVSLPHYTVPEILLPLEHQDMLKGMDFQVALVEKVENSGNSIVASSGLRFGNFVLITSNIFAQELLVINKEGNYGKIQLNPFKNRTFKVSCILKNNNGTYEVKKADVFAAYLSKNIKKSDIFFTNFAVDSVDNSKNLGQILSTFFILSLVSTCTFKDLRHSLNTWWNLVGRENLRKCDEICINSSAFANRNFLNSVSKGIVSNILGEDSCIVLSDCPSTPGSEGSPVYVRANGTHPVGIVLSSVCFWRGEWTGLTIIADIRSILIELVDFPVRFVAPIKEVPSHLVVANCEFSLIQIYSGTSWGTAILLDSKNGVFITNSHVIVEEDPILHYKNKQFNGKVLYQTPENSSYDLAIIECRTILRENLKPILISRIECKVGETVYSGGFSLYSKEVQPTPTLTKGYIATKHKFMLKTTCSIHAGSSGGAIMNENGLLVGIIVSNTLLNDKNVVFPRISMAIPFTAIYDIIEKYLRTHDVAVLRELGTSTDEIASLWRLEAKL